MEIIPGNLQNAALDSNINLGKVEAENAGITVVTARISNEQIDQINDNICNVLGTNWYNS